MASETMMQVADKFFEACETGKGWEECKKYCTPDAEFECAVLPQKRLDEYTEWMKGMIAGVAPDAKYNIISKTSNDTEVTYVCGISGTHTLPGGPVPPSDPPKKMFCHYSYTIFVNSDHKVTKLFKIWDQMTAFNSWGWPLPKPSA